MNKGRFQFKNFVASFESEASEALVLLHGFPAEPACDPRIEKNVDFAEAIAKLGKFDVFVHHYAGLGKSKHKTFSFIESIEDSVLLCRKLMNNYEKISLFGHSWGGFVALNILNEIGLNHAHKIMLVSPFAIIPERAELKSALESASRECPEILATKGIVHYLDEFEIMRERMNPYSFQLSLKTIELAIWQCKDDREVPKEATLELVRRFAVSDSFKVIDTDHSLGRQRDKIKNMLVDFFDGESKTGPR